MEYNTKHNPYYLTANEVKFTTLDVIRKQMRIAITWNAYIPEKTSNAWEWSL